MFAGVSPKLLPLVLDYLVGTLIRDSSWSPSHFLSHLVQGGCGWTFRSTNPVPENVSPSAGSETFLHHVRTMHTEMKTGNSGPSEIWVRARGEMDRFVYIPRYLST